LAAPGADAADLRVHRHGHRRARLAHGRRARRRPRGRPAAVRELLLADRRPHRGPGARARPPAAPLRPDGSQEVTTTTTEAPGQVGDGDVTPSEAAAPAGPNRLGSWLGAAVAFAVLACLPLLNLS